ncbi:MAG: hypothetical protein C9356_17700 [Oleiphilus sp.]|nr:MAG: hypothetical protein C9356_17700 [Oleiphilus sp.]
MQSMFASESKSENRSTNKKKAGTWSKLVALCTHVMGGYYRSNGTIVRNVASGKTRTSDEAIFVETDVEFASINERTHSRVRYQETQWQENLETILSLVSGLIGKTSPIDPIDPDWATLFFDYAQKVSNKTMQSLWARAMVSELRHPGSISKRSLHFLYHCDAWEIVAFKKVANYAFIGSNGHPFLFRSEHDVDNNDDIFSEARMLSHCINAGLIGPTPRDLLVGFQFEYDNKTHRVTHDVKTVGQATGFLTMSFTKIGSDIVKLLGGLEAIPSSNMQRRVVWDHLSDFIDLEVEQEQSTSLAG